MVLRGAILNRTYGTYKTYIVRYFSNKIWSYLLWSPVIERACFFSLLVFRVGGG